MAETKRGVWLAVVRIGKDGLLKTLYEPALEMLMMRLDPARYALHRTVLGGLGFSMGMGAAALVLLTLTFGLGAQKRTVLGLLVVATLLWGATVALLRAGAKAPAENQA